DFGAVALVASRCGGRPASVQAAGPGAYEPEEPRAVCAHVPPDAARRRAVRVEQAGREDVGHDEVPVRPVAGGGQRRVRPGAVSERCGNEERAVGKSPGRGARGLPERAVEPGRCPSGARWEPWVVEARPPPSHREQALPDRRLSMEPDYGPSDVGRERLAVEKPPPGGPGPVPSP